MLEVSDSRKKLLKKLFIAQEGRALPITYRISKDFIWLCFDEKILKDEVQVKTRQDTVFSVDLNPNYIGWCCTEWKSESSYKIIDHGVVDFKALNDKQESLEASSEDPKSIHLNNKRKHELLQACKWLVNKAAYYQCSIFGIEDLNIKSSGKGKGRKFNRLCNNC